MPIFPYLDAAPWHVGPFAVHPFGLLVFAGVMLGVHTCARRARRTGLASQHVYPAILATAFGGFAVSHIVELALYQPDRPVGGFLRAVNLYEGMSSLGGFVGGLIGVACYAAYFRLPLQRYADAIVWGLAHGWLVARVGCAFAHDHPGIFTSSWFSVRWPADHPDQALNVAQLPGRHDLGLYEVFLTAVVLVALYATNRRATRPPGFNIMLFFLLYAPVRFLLDFLRMGDARYLGWTPGQYASVGFFLWAVALLVRQYKTRAGAAG